MKPNNTERIDIITVGLSARRKKKKRKTVNEDRRTPGVVGRRRPASSRDGTSQKPDTPPTPQGREETEASEPALPTPKARRRRDGEDGGSAVVWRGRDESLVQRTTSRPIFIHASHAANRQAINHRIIKTLPAVYALAIMQK